MVRTSIWHPRRRTRASNIQLSHPDLPYWGPDRSKVSSYLRTMQPSPMYSTSRGNTWPSQLNMRSPEEKQLQPDASHNITTTQEDHKAQTMHKPVHPENSKKRNNRSISSRKHHLSLEPPEVWICDMVIKRFNISLFAFYFCIYSSPHLFVYKYI